MTVSTGRLGPLVHRSVRHGAILWIVGVLQFVVGMAVTEVGYSGTSYSLTGNYISDLGAAHCGIYHSSIYVCSPWHDVFNVSIVLLGILLILGTLLIRTAFRPRAVRTVGLALLIISGVGAIGVGLSPEDVNLSLHSASALASFLGSNLAMMILALAMFRDTRWDGYRTFTMVMGLVGLVALILFTVGTYGPLGVGGMERLDRRPGTPLGVRRRGPFGADPNVRAVGPRARTELVGAPWLGARPRNESGVVELEPRPAPEAVYVAVEVAAHRFGKRPPTLRAFGQQRTGGAKGRSGARFGHRRGGGERGKGWEGRLA